MTPLKLAEGLTEELLEVIHKYDGSIPLVSVLGVLRVIEVQLVRDHIGEDEDGEDEDD